MFGLGKLRFRGPDRKIIEDEEHVNDYNTAETTGRVNLGKLCLYYHIGECLGYCVNIMCPMITLTGHSVVSVNVSLMTALHTIITG